MNIPEFFQFYQHPAHKTNPMSNSEPVAQIHELVKNYGAFRAVDHLSLCIEKGDVFGFLGPNGAGKSTTIRTILGLIRPDAGKINMFGLPHGTPPWQYLHRIGALVEKADFYPYLNARQTLQQLGSLQPTPISSTRIDEILEITGLSGRDKKPVKTFSQGMKQRLGIAQALLHNPDFLILDEPTNGLDPQGVIDIRNLIISLHREHGKTILVSSHILSEIEIISNKMAIINKGKCVVQGSVNDLLLSRDLKVTFEFAEAPGAAIGEIIQAEKIINADSRKLVCHMKQEDIPEVTRLMVEKGIKIKGIMNIRALEDLYLSLI
jgi:ABC-type multidrug transport system ATPase subunit